MKEENNDVTRFTENGMMLSTKLEFNFWRCQNVN